MIGGFIAHTDSASLNIELANVNQQIKNLQTRKNEILKKIEEQKRVENRQLARYGGTSKITAQRRYENAKVTPRYSRTELSKFVPVGRQNPETGQQDLYYATKVTNVYKKRGKTYRVKRTS